MVNYFRAYYFLQGLLRRAYWSHERMQDYQNRKLRQILQYAYVHVPYYHERFKKLGIRPSDIKTVKDLNILPILRKEDIRSNLGKMISREFDVVKLQIRRTSGSTGEPLYFYISNSEDEYRKAKHLRANMGCGQKPRDRWVMITSPMYFNQATKLQRITGIFAPLSVSVYDHVNSQVSTISKLKPDVVDGYASSILLLAREIEKKGVDSIRPKLLISGADLIEPHSRKFVEKVINAPFFDQYGCAELERLAWQCEEKAGYHIDADSVIMQFVDENGEEVAPGERGEIVCTSLFNYAMPFIRYAVGDVGKASRMNDCPCGRTLPLMEVIEGRRDSVVLLPDGRALSSFVFIAATYQLSFYNNIEKFRVIQKRIDKFEFIIKLKGNNIDECLAEEELKNLFCKVFNVNADMVEFKVEFVDDIPLDRGGKFRIFVSEIE